MRRSPISGPGLFVLAAAAVPILIKSAKPLAKKIGQAMEKYGSKLQEAAEEEIRNKHKTADQPADQDTESVPKESPEKSTATNLNEPKIPDSPKAEDLGEPRANKARQTKPKAKTTPRPRPKKTVKSTPSTKTTAMKPADPQPKD